MEQLDVIQEVADCSVEATTQSLLKCLQLVLPIVPAKSNQNPIFENFLIDISGGYLKATGYDHKNTIVTEQQLDPERIHGKIKVCLNAHILVNLLKTLPPSEQIALVFEGNNVDIISEAGTYQLFGESEVLFPEIKHSNLKESLVLDAEFVNRLIAINYACSGDYLRPAMNGICMKFKADFTEFVATNGYIIHLIRRFDIKLKHPEVIIPGKELSSLSDIIKNKQYIKLSLMQNHVAFSTDDSKYLTLKIDQRYPDYDELINIPARYKIRLSKHLLVSSLNRINILQPAGDVITFVISSKQIVFKAQSIFGTVNEVFNIENSSKIDEDGVTVSFYLSKLLLALKHLHGTDLEVLIATPNKIVTITPAIQQENEEVLVMVVPVLTPNYDEPTS